MGVSQHVDRGRNGDNVNLVTCSACHTAEEDAPVSECTLRRFPPCRLGEFLCSILVTFADTVLPGEHREGRGGAGARVAKPVFGSLSLSLQGKGPFSRGV